MPTNRNTWNRSSNSSTRRATGSLGGGYNNFSSYGTTNRRTSGASSFGASNTRSNWSSPSYSPSQFSTARETINAKICSYRTLNQQFTGAGKVTAFSPTTCNKWIDYVDDGCFIYKFSNPDFCRFFGSQYTNCSPTQAFRTLRNRFGTGIKAVTRGKSNTWLIAASDRVSARPFATYNWK